MLVFEFALQDSEYLGNGFILQIGPACNVIRIKRQDALCRVATYGLQTLDNPGIDLVVEFAEQHVLFLLLGLFLLVAPYFNFASYQHTCKFDIAAAAAYTFLHLFREHIYPDSFVLVGADYHRGNLRRGEGALDKQLFVCRPLNNVDVFVAKLPYDADNTRTFYAYAGSYRINSLVIALYGYFCPLAGNTDNFLDCNQPIIDFRHFLLEKFLEEIV